MRCLYMNIKANGMATAILLRATVALFGLSAHMTEYFFYRFVNGLEALFPLGDIYESHHGAPLHAVGEVALVKTESLARASFDKIATHGPLTVTLAHRKKHTHTRHVTLRLCVGRKTIGSRVVVNEIDAPERERKERIAIGKQCIYLTFEANSFYFGKSVIHRPFLIWLSRVPLWWLQRLLPLCWHSS